MSTTDDTSNGSVEPHGSTERETTSTSLERYVRSRYDEIRELPRHGCWTFAAVDVKRGALSTARNVGLIEKVGSFHTEKDTPAEGTSNATVWTMTELGRETLDNYDQGTRQMPMPCGHSGFQNTGEFLLCKECGGRFTKTEVQEYDP